MNVIMVCDVLGPENNGTTIAAMNLYRHLVKKGHNVRVVCPDKDKEGLDGFYVVSTVNFGPFNEYVRKNGVTLSKPDDGILREAMKGADVVHCMVPFALSRRAAEIAREEGIPVSSGFHAMAENFTCHIHMQNFGPANRITYAEYHKTYKNADAIHYPTQYLRDINEKMYGKTNGYVISNGVNSRFRPKEVVPKEKYAGKTVILFTGRLSREKSHKVLIDAVNLSAHRETVQLVFAGSGPLREKLERYSEKLPNKPEIGFFGRDEMVDLINTAYLYVHPAEIEAEGISCLEAIACGLVPIISDSPRCATQSYAIGENCLFRYNDPSDLAKKIDYWIDHPSERAEMSRRYVEMAGDRFDQEKCMERMEKMLAETAAIRKTAAK